MTGEQTWILGTMPLRSGRRPEKHPAVEEWHGPFGSPTGNLMLFRTVGGPLSTEYTEHEVGFSWTPEHRPILPEGLRPYGQPLPAGGCAAH